jgi:O-methyltransferase involved in polyketide biosynthesis
VTWYDVDYPEVIALRSTLYPERGHYHMISSSVTAPSWLAQVPADRPTLIVAEGLTMYLKPEEGHELMRRLTGHFVHGIIAFDAFNRLTIRVQHLNPAARGCGARMSWGIDDPAKLERASPRLHCLEAAKALYTPGAAALPLSTRITAKLFRPSPRFATCACTCAMSSSREPEIQRVTAAGAATYGRMASINSQILRPRTRRQN